MSKKLTLATPRLVLRDFQLNDWKAVHEYASDERVVEFLEWGPNAPPDTIQFIEGSIARQRDHPRQIFEFAVVLRESETLIGACGIRVNPQDAEQAEVGYCYNRRYWAKGYAREACRAVVDFGFTELSLHRIYAMCDSRNAGSAKVLAGAGMRLEGESLQDKKIRGIWRDTLHFAILKEEWLNGRRE